MSMTSESNESLIFKNDVDSPSVDDTNSGENVLKKGPWTSDEDAILVEHVTKHGEGNWNAIQKHSGLARCGKSCRLRWTNHLRPDLKKGAFSPEEEHLIVELHAKMGNKWARMAAELPGRTDNEIKNYWNTRIKRLQRAGLPIYPPDIGLQSLKETQQTDDMTTFSSNDAYHPDFIPFTNFEFPSVEFKNLKVNHDLHASSALIDIPSDSSLLAQGLHSVHPSKRLRGSEYLFPALNPVNDDPVQIAQSFVYSSPYDHNSTCDHPSSVIVGSHSGLNGNPSSSEPDWAMKMELPSLQIQMGSYWASPSSPLISYESVDIPIRAPPIENTISNNRNSGLLDAVLYESQTMNTSKNSSISNASNVEVDIRDTSSHDFFKTEWEAYGEHMSPFGHSCSSIFNEGTPISRSSFDEPESVERGCKVKEEATILVPMRYEHKGDETTNEMIVSRPDMLLASDWFGPKRFHCW
ncbi:hypothetical protein BUALT_Bualt02G0171500 [Buddleja alternifolia]|uniref:Transcription factor GAMYB n=1 Tax=Buddleja alternifolia TaxID=168488 RepID=A0AAV6YBN0_9LAMI|nr:hypothetical protein BUALT_Bualt02G0171500 [Buddleja alternifolia]